MSVPALAARAPAGAATANAGTAPGGAAASAGAPGECDNVFAALLAGLGEAAEAAPAGEDAAALPGDLPVDVAAAALDPAAPAAAPDPLAGMALLMAQYTTVVPPGNAPAGTAAPSGAPSAAGSAQSAASGAGLAPAMPSALSAAPGVAPAKTSSPVLPGADLFNTPGPARPDAAEPAALALLPALAADAAPGQTAPDAQAAQAALQTLPDMASLTGGWAATPTPAAAQGPAAAAPVYQAELPSRPGDAAFTGDLAAQVTVLVEGGFQQAELRLNPADLGPIQIQLSVSAQTQTADISFSAVHGLTRESIERALPELRDLLEAQGLSLGQTGVSGGQQQGGDARDGAAAQARQAWPGAGQGAEIPPAQSGLPGLGGLAGAARATRGMLDLYA